MNKSFTILIGLALLLGAGSLFLIKRLVETEREKAKALLPPPTAAQEPTVEMSSVLVVKENLETGTPLTDMNVGIEQLPKKVVPEGALTSMEQIKDRFAVQNLFKGQVLFDAEARTREELPKASLMITPGKRLISVRVDEVKANGFMIKNGDFVDLVGGFEVPAEMLPPSADRPLGNRITVTFLQRVRIFDIVHGTSGNPQDNQNQGAGRMAMGTTATFEVSPQEADIITNAESTASSIWLVLRRFDDETITAPKTDLEKNIIASLLRTTPEAPVAPPPPAAPKRRPVF